MTASPPNANPSEFDATQFHSEFGYLAPTIRFRRKVALTLKSCVLGGLVGAVAVFLAMMDREERAFTMLATPAVPTPVEPEPAQATMALSTAAPSAPSPAPSASLAPKASAPAPTSPAATSRAPVPPAAAAPASAAAARRTAAAGGWPSVRFVPEAFALPGVVAANPPVRSAAPPSAAVAPSTLVPQESGHVLAIAGAPAPAEFKGVAKPKKKVVREPQAEPTARQAPPQPEQPRSVVVSTFQRLGSIFGLGL